MNIQKAVDFLKNLEGYTIIFHHDDADGCCSAALIIAFIKKMGIKYEVYCGDIDKSSFEKFATIGGKNYIFLDLSVDNYPEWIEPFRNTNCLIIDHHPVINDLNERGFIYVNPRLDDPDIYISCSEVCLKICKELGMKGLEWLSRIGAAGDRSIEGNEEEKAAAAIVSSIKAIEGREALSKLAKFLASSKKIEDLIENPEYIELKNRIEKEIQNQIEKFEIEGIRDINVFEIKANYSIMALVANRIFDLYPDKTVILYRKGEGKIKFTARSPNFDMGKILREAAKGLGTGGGHPRAAGAKIRERDLDKFLKRIRDLTSS